MSAATDMELAERALDEAWETKQAAERAVITAQGVLWHAQEGLKTAIAARDEDHANLQRAHAAYMVEYENERNQDHGDVGAIMAQIEGGGA